MNTAKPKSKYDRLWGVVSAIFFATFIVGTIAAALGVGLKIQGLEDAAKVPFSVAGFNAVIFASNLVFGLMVGVADKSPTTTD